MSGILSHSPAKVIRQLLIDAGILFAVTSGTADNVDWTAFVNNHPDAPDNSVALYNTAAVTHGRTQVDGVTQKHYGIQTRVRAQDANTGYTKAREIYDAYEAVLRTAVEVDSVIYMVQAINCSGDILDIGFDGSSKRRLFTINVRTDIRILSSMASDFYDPDFNDEDFN